MHPKALREKIKNKRVVLICPSQAACKKHRGKEIEEFDTIVRMGNGYKVKGLETSVGKRTDILFHSLRPKVKWQGIEAIDLKTLQERKLRFIMYFNGGKNRMRHKRMRKALRKHKIIAVPSKKNLFSVIYQQAKVKNIKFKKLSIAPLQGIVAIISILQHKPKELTIIGKDFYESSHQDNYKSKKMKRSAVRAQANRAHNLRYQKYILVKCIQAFDNISIDSTTRDSLLRMKNLSTEVAEKITNITNRNL